MMPGTSAAVLLGLLLSVVNFAVFIAMSAWALRRETTTASAILAAGFIVRLTVVFGAYIYFVGSPVWEPLIYWITAGFIPSQVIFLAIEIAFVMRTEKRLNGKQQNEQSESDLN
jgi:hypothetical protein